MTTIEGFVAAYDSTQIVIHVDGKQYDSMRAAEWLNILNPADKMDRSIKAVVLEAARSERSVVIERTY